MDAKGLCGEYRRALISLSPLAPGLWGLKEAQEALKIHRMRMQSVLLCWERAPELME